MLKIYESLKCISSYTTVKITPDTKCYYYLMIEKHLCKKFCLPTKRSLAATTTSFHVGGLHHDWIELVSL